MSDEIERKLREFACQYSEALANDVALSRSKAGLSERVLDWIDIECEDVKQMLISKNKKYGNSFMRPLNIFSKLSADEGLNVRIDDKLNRIFCGQCDDLEDTILDLTGYLILKRVLKRLDDESV